MSSVETEAFDFEPLEPEGGLVLAAGATPLTRAAEIVEQARSEAASLAAAAEQEGFRRGYEDGLARADTVLSEARAGLEAVAAALEAERDATAARTEVHAVELALMLARKIVAASVAVEPALVLSVVEGALRRLAERDRIVIEVDPADHAIVRDAIDGVVEALGGVRSVEVLSDPRVGRGGCVVRTAEVEIDARVEEQLARAEEILRDALAAAAAAAGDA